MIDRADWPEQAALFEIEGPEGLNDGLDQARPASRSRSGQANPQPQPGNPRGMGDHAGFHRVAYGKQEPIAELIPAIIGTFIAGDRAFAAWRRQHKQGD